MSRAHGYGHGVLAALPDATGPMRALYPVEGRAQRIALDSSTSSSRGT
jgi:hypothetical protein